MHVFGRVPAPGAPDLSAAATVCHELVFKYKQVFKMEHANLGFANPFRRRLGLFCASCPSWHLERNWAPTKDHIAPPPLSLRAKWPQELSGHKKQGEPRGSSVGDGRRLNRLGSYYAHLGKRHQACLSQLTWPRGHPFSDFYIKDSLIQLLIHCAFCTFPSHT